MGHHDTPGFGVPHARLDMSMQGCFQQCKHRYLSRMINAYYQYVMLVILLGFATYDCIGGIHITDLSAAYVYW